VEFKQCNIFAMLRDMGLTYISGYKPRGNYQDLLATIVAEHLVANPSHRKKVVEMDIDPLSSPPDGSSFALADIEVSPPEPTDRKPLPTRAKPVKTDWAAANAYSCKLGEQGSGSSSIWNAAVFVTPESWTWRLR
jgi:hypothetical protein